MSHFFDLSPLHVSYRSPARSTRTADRHADLCKRLCEARQHDSVQPEAAGGSPAPARTPRRAAARKPASRDDDSDGEPAPARRGIAPIFLDLDAVADALALSTRGVQRLVQEGNFPKPRALSARRVAWLTEDVIEWARRRPTADMLTPPNAGQRA
ncbi:helix-turn-helix transcriptional regulator [Paraburkholderia haematera]|uniref:helix-turn-helix transcriptional regulator n=1 Tax=Paraburkholderia haematera TaxID=2793077 RepID=UPI001F28A06C|nr:AlpA family phage regulatory protein [Paraburkholderia haematera]